MPSPTVDFLLGKALMHRHAAGDLTPAGSTTQVQYNDGGNLGASSRFTYDGSTLKLKANGSANLQEWQDSSGTALTYIASNQSIWTDTHTGRGAQSGFFNVRQNGSVNPVLSLYQATDGQAVHLYSPLGLTFDNGLTISPLVIPHGGYILSGGGTWKAFAYDSAGLLFQTQNIGIQSLIALQCGSGQTNPNVQIYDDSSRKLAAWYPTGAMEVNYADASTSTVQAALTLRRTVTSGTPAAGLGVQQVFRLNSSTTADRAAVDITASWVTATDASRAARAVVSVYDTSARECLRMEASGTAAMLGFYGSAATAKQTVTGSKGANAALASLLTALATLGLITDSTT